MNGLEIRMVPHSEGQFHGVASGRSWLGKKLKEEQRTPLIDALFESQKVSIESLHREVRVIIRGRDTVEPIVKHHLSDIMALEAGKVAMKPVKLEVEAPELPVRTWTYQVDLLWEEGPIALNRKFQSLAEPIRAGLEGHEIPQDFLRGFFHPWLWSEIVRTARDYGESDALAAEDPMTALHIEKIRGKTLVNVGGTRFSMLTHVRFRSPVMFSGAPMHVGRLRGRGYGRLLREF